MKRLLTLVIVAILCLPLLAQDINSFRNLSTGSALDDDADLAFDPIELNYLKGTTVFSNLSNIGGSDKIFMNSGAQHFLMGLATEKCRINKLKAAILFKYYDNKTPGSIQYYPNPWDSMISATGEVDYTWQEYSDVNMNGLYDKYRIIKQNYKSLSYSKGMDFYLNLAYELNKANRLGFKLGVNNVEIGNNRSSMPLLNFSSNSPTTDYSDMYQSLLDSDPSIPESYYERTMKGDFVSEDTYSDILAELAYSITMGDLDLRAALKFELIDSKTSHDDLANETLKSLNQPDEMEMESYLSSLEEKGNYTALALGIRKTFNAARERRNDSYVSLSAQVGMLNMDVSEEETWTGDEQVSGNYHSIASESMKQEGELSGFDMKAHLRINYPLNSKTYFGTGLLYYYSDQKQKGDFTMMATETDSSFTSVDNTWYSTQTGNMLMTGKTEHNYNSTTISIPVGIEYWFTNNNQWTLRFGSVFSQYVSTINELFQPENVEPYSYVEVYADGSETDVWNEDNEYVIDSESRVTRSSSATYCYGVGYKPSSNLQIDVMGIFDSSNTDIWNTNFFRNLRLAFTLCY